MKEKYKSLIRQLPSKAYIEKLVDTYFREVNHQYSPLDEGIFRDLLTRWHGLSFSTLNKGPLQLPGDLQFFPALLFQVLALALQFQPLNYDQGLDSLKYAAGMSFDDLASDYSESGVSILNLLGKRHTTLVTVQSGFLRTAYLKNCGMVPESWHSLSQTIRDAQEIGLHKTSKDNRLRKPDDNPGDVLENLWLEQLRRRMWLLLSLWDIHMALVLGRPTTIDPRDGKPFFPIDAPAPANRREEAPAPRTETDPPTSLTVLLWSSELSAPLWDIFNLEKEDPHQNNFAKVEEMHKLINQISLHCPPFFRSQNPDTTFDDHPSCYWLPCARPMFQNYTAFTIMALHRPYIFTSSSSRTAALKAGLDILRAQRTLFNLLSSVHYKMFSLVLNTFDAIVLAAAIYILYPYENRDDLDDTLQHFEWGMQRFQTMSGRNAMAKAALGVLKAIYVRFKRALSQKQPSPRAASTTGSVATPPICNQGLPTPETYSSSTTTPNPQFDLSTTPRHSISAPSTNNSNNNNTHGDGNISSTTTTQYTQPTISNLTTSTLDVIPPPMSTTVPAWESFSMPQPLDFSSMAPLQPMHDLLYNDLGTSDLGTVADGPLDLNLAGFLDGGMGGVLSLPPSLERILDTGARNSGGGGGGWQFEGDFGNDSFWGFMNNYNPSDQSNSMARKGMGGEWGVGMYKALDGR